MESTDSPDQNLNIRRAVAQFSTILAFVRPDAAISARIRRIIVVFDVVLYSTGSAGVSPLASLSVFHCSRNWIDVVIVDYCMPEMNGQEVAIEMRKLKPQAKIIMLSGAVDVPEDVLTSVDAFVTKDRLASQLLSAIEQLTAPSDPGQLRPLGSDTD